MTTSARRTRVALVVAGVAAVLALATWIRFTQLDFGIPFNLHPDESPKVRTARALIERGIHNTHYYNHPYLLLRLIGWTGWLTAKMAWLPPETPVWWVAGRAAVAAAGVVNVLLAFLLARELAGDHPTPEGKDGDVPSPRAGPGTGVLAGFAAALLLAVTPLHVVHSRYIKEDVLLGLCLTATALFAVRLARRGNLLDLAAGAVAAGLAVSTKFVGIAALPLVAGAAVAGTVGRNEPATARRRYASLALLGLVPLAIFAVVNAPMLANFDAAARDLSHEIEHTAGTNLHPSVSPWEWGWTFHLRNSLLPGLGWALLAASILGGFALLRFRDRGRLAFVAFPVLWYLMHEGAALKPSPNWERYMVPMAPLACVAAGFLVTLPVRVAPSRRKGAVVAVALLLLGSFTLAALRTRDLTRDMLPDTRVLCREWLERNLVPGAVVVIDHYGAISLRQSSRLQNIQLGLFRDRVDYCPDVDTSTWTATVTLPGGRKVTQPVAAVVTSSFWRNAWVGKGQTGPFFDSAVQFYERMDAHFNLEVVIDKPSGPYAFHNPELKIHLRPGVRRAPVK